MPVVAQLLEARRVRTTRPDHYEELLLRPVVDGVNPELSQFGSYVGWERDHCIARRFYVAGIHWFLETTGINQTMLTYHRDKAHRRVLGDTSWADMPDPAGHWRKALGRPQIRHACNSEPMPFAKAAQVLVLCEIVLEEMMREPREGVRIPGGFLSAEEIHGYMAVYPACWNIDDFGEPYIEQVRRNYGDPYQRLKEAAGLRSSHAITDLASGSTVTYETASRIREYAFNNFRVPDLQVGSVRAKPGRYLGSEGATEKEEVDVG